MSDGNWVRVTDAARSFEGLDLSTQTESLGDRKSFAEIARVSITLAEKEQS